jgi:hypothetical protein
MKALIALLVLSSGAPAQDPTTEETLIKAVEATREKGFTYAITPVVSMPDALPSDRAALSGAPVRGVFADGIAHARDGSYEVFRSGERVVARSERGWLPLDQFTAPLRQDASQAFDPVDGRLWRRGNVTAGRKALHQLIQLSHLVQRTDIERLTRIARMFSEIRKVSTTKIDGKEVVLYEGDLSDAACLDLLTGPFEELVKRGTLAFSAPSGVGRVYLQDGLVRRVVLKVAGKWSYYNDDDNVRRKGLCTLEILGDLTRVGQTTVEVPKEARSLLEEQVR